MTDLAIETKSLTKEFNGIRAVDNLDMMVPQGAVFGFLGENGAGKTTTIRMLMGHLHPTAGEVYTLGSDPRTHGEGTRQRVAYVSENMNLPGWMTPESACGFCSALYPAWNRKLEQALLDDFELRNGKKYHVLSKGQKRRLCILLALCQTPELLVMDEPASGLDALARREFLERVLDVACSEGGTVFFSSHILSDMERVVDRVAIISKGRLKLEGELDSLKQSARKLHLPVAVSIESLGEYFKVASYATTQSDTTAVVLDFDESRFRFFCEKEGCAETAREWSLNLEDLFVEVATNEKSKKE